jgi:hypothetical protein
MPYDYTLSPVYDKFPNILNILNPISVLCTLILLSLCLFLNKFTSVSSLLLWYGWACLLNRNILIQNPGIPYVGWMLLAYTLLGCASFDKFRDYRIYYYGWFLLCLGYTVSGLHKLSCISWLNGNAVEIILSGALSRNNILCNIILSLPPSVLKLLTWSSLALEITYLPLGSFYHLRPLYSFLGIMFQIGILLTINFADLTFGMIMIHLFVAKVIH